MSWRVIPDRSLGKAGIQVYRDDKYIMRLALSDLGIPENEMGLLCRWLPNKIGSLLEETVAPDSLATFFEMAKDTAAKVKDIAGGDEDKARTLLDWFKQALDQEGARPEPEPEPEPEPVNEPEQSDEPDETEGKKKELNPFEQEIEQTEL